MNRICSVVIVMLIGIPAFAGVVEDSGIKGGLVVQVGCRKAKSLADLLVSEKYLVHGLDVNEKRISRIRRSLLSGGMYGKVSAAVFDGKNLPYADNLVNLLVIKDRQCRVQKEEMLRVLVPGGVAIVQYKYSSAHKSLLFQKLRPKR